MATESVRKVKKSGRDELKVSVGSLVSMRVSFYEKGFKVLSVVTALSLIVAILSVFVLINKEPPRESLFGVDQSGRVFPVQRLSAEVYKDSDVRNWVTGVVLELYEFDYLNYRSQVARVLEASFTANGIKEYNEAASQTNFFGEIEESGAIVSAGLLGAPTVEDKRDIDGRYRWLIKVPIKIQYNTRKNGKQFQSVYVEVVVVRSSFVAFEKGIAIDQVFTTEFKGDI